MKGSITFIKILSNEPLTIRKLKDNVYIKALKSTPFRMSFYIEI